MRHTAFFSSISGKILTTPLNRGRFGLPVLIFCGMLAAAGCRDPGQTERDRHRLTVEELTGGHTRVVWTQDTEELRDVFGGGSRLRLMGYDSRDGRGERIILPGPAPILKPLFTPDGEQVVYSVIEEDATYIVNWDGGGHRRLADGMAVATWRDPADGRDWLYIGRDVRDERGFCFPRIVRAPLDQIKAEETVWDGPLMAMDNIQLSADGRRASSLFPWPKSGVAHFPNGGFDRIGRGCWTAMAPDDSGIMWTLDGAHRNLLMADTRGDDRWTINLSQAPVIGGHEIYHPRWSNHPYLMVLSGPYTIRAGGNNIRGGGPEVEIQIGRFSRDRRSIEEWAQVSKNDYLNVYPDLWVKPAAPIPRPSPAGARVRNGEPETAWPAVTDHLAYLWRNRDAANRVETGDGEIRDCNPEPAGSARYGRHLGMDLRRGYFVDRDAGPAVAEEMGETGEFTFQAWLTPEGEGDRAAAIWGVGEGDTDVRAGLSIVDGQLCLRWRTESARLNGVEEGGGPRHLAVTCAAGRVSVYRDGEPVGEADLPSFHPGSWAGGPIYFGGTPLEGTNWSGFMEGVAWHTRALSPGEISREAAAYRATAGGRPAAETVTVRAELTEASAIPSPADIAPYRRGLVVNEYRVIEVLNGDLEAEKILAAHWVIMDGRTLKTARREPGREYTMRLEPYEGRPELQGERLSMDTENILLATYFDIDS
ncbi:MAG: LamG-like jellyroll fold domain-containing protein [Candidatus Erginobacter occultus]|nr:LamG-like jellyroll fold domain-containing protein [Candidatus Erginobacter occultus]